MDKPNQTSATELLARSITDLDLETLPERLTDEQWAMVKQVRDAPLPCLPPCDDRHLAQALRMMLAVLPRQQSDDLAGELFVEAYRRQLGDQPSAAITYLADQAMRQCRWFPTIAECLEILSGWRRCDADVMRQQKARTRYSEEYWARNPRPDKIAEPEWNPTPAELDKIKAEMAAKWPSNRA